MQKLQIASVLADQAKKMGKVLEEEQFTLLNVQLRAGEEIPPHSANNTAVVIVRKGEVVFDVEGKEVTLKEEDVLIFEPNEMHGLVATTDVDLVIVKMN